MIDRLDFANFNKPVLNVLRGGYEDAMAMILRLTQNLEMKIASLMFVQQIFH